MEQKERERQVEVEHLEREKQMELEANARNKEMQDKVRLENISSEGLKIEMEAKKEREKIAAKIKKKELEYKTINGVKAWEIETLKGELECMQSEQTFIENDCQIMHDMAT